MLQPDSIIKPLISFGIAFVPAVIGIVCHEVAHGYVAWRLGDPTAKQAGRLTLNPIKHVDPTGLAVFVFTALFTRFVIGWAKPVPVHAGYFKKPRSGMMLVAIAGPATNFILALIFALIFKLILSTVSPFASEVPQSTIILLNIASMGVLINCLLGIFNLIPLPPLDGSHIISGLLPEHMVRAYWAIGKYSMFIILILLFSGLFGKIMFPALRMAVSFICLIAGINPSFIL